MKVSGADDLVETPQETSIEVIAGYKNDILLAKKSTFEEKMFIKVLNELDKTYETASSKEDLEKLIKTNNYKFVIFDKEYTDLDVATFSSMVKELNNSKEFKSKLVLVTKPNTDIDENDTILVDEVINEKITKELLTTVFEKLS